VGCINFVRLDIGRLSPGRSEDKQFYYEVKMNEKMEHKFTPEEKIAWWGKGEWVNEPDLVTFEHMGIQCRVLRIAMEEPHAKDFHMFGGFLNGYVCVPVDHLFYQKEYQDIDIDCHGGLTFGECSDRHWIGFDCAHSFDYVPSTEYMTKTAEWMKDFRDREEDWKKRFNLQDSPLFNRSYRNIQFCIDQCKSMAEQLVQTSSEKKII